MNHLFRFYFIGNISITISPSFQKPRPSVAIATSRNHSYVQRSTEYCHVWLIYETMYDINDPIGVKLGVNRWKQMSIPHKSPFRYGPYTKLEIALFSVYKRKKYLFHKFPLTELIWKNYNPKDRLRCFICFVHVTNKSSSFLLLHEHLHSASQLHSKDAFLVDILFQTLLYEEGVGHVFEENDLGGAKFTWREWVKS